MSVARFETVAATAGRGLHTWGGMLMIIWLIMAWPAGRAGEEEGFAMLLQGTAEAERATRAWPGDANCGM